MEWIEAYDDNAVERIERVLRAALSSTVVVSTEGFFFQVDFQGELVMSPGGDYTVEVRGPTGFASVSFLAGHVQSVGPWDRDSGLMEIVL